MPSPQITLDQWAALIAVVRSKQPDAVVTVGSFLSHEWAHGPHYFRRGAALALPEEPCRVCPLTVLPPSRREARSQC